MRYLLISFLILTGCTTVIRTPKRKTEVSNQEKIIRCVDNLMKKHGISIAEAADFCFNNYRRSSGGK